MFEFSVSDLIEATGGVLYTTSAADIPYSHRMPYSQRIEGLSVDSRQVRPGDVFWAMAGATLHGANFVHDAFRNGAIGVVTDAKGIEPSGERWVLRVAGARESLWQLARRMRSRFEGKVVAVGGCVGKTITTEMIATVLGSKLPGPRTVPSYDRDLHVPLSILGWRPTNAFAAVEMCASRIADVVSHAELCRPHIGVVTRLALTEDFASDPSIETNESLFELLASLPADGSAIVNGDDPRLRDAAWRTQARIRSVGRSGDCDLTACDVRFRPGELSFRVGGHQVRLSVWGRHYLTPALAAIAVGQEFGLDWNDILAALESFRAPPERCEVIRHRGAAIIEDVHNGSPEAVRAALDLLGEFEVPGRRVVVCDVNDADEPNHAHRKLGEEVVTRCGADMLVAYGEHAEEMVAGACDAGMPEPAALSCRDAQEAANYVEPLLTEGNAILVKSGTPSSVRCLFPDIEFDQGDMPTVKHG